jgi:flagellar hook protein FlgE
MSLFGAFRVSVEGIRGQGVKARGIGVNIANASTVGYKAGQVVFSSLVNNAGGGRPLSQ